MQHSDAINELLAALSKAQGVMEGASKQKINPAFRSKYADLASVWDAAREPLSANGLAIVQTVAAEGNAVAVTTLLGHVSGQWIKGTVTMTAKDAGPQAIGSVITYGRRYGLSAIVGIAPEDDDAEAGEGRKPPVTPTAVKPQGYDAWLSLTMAPAAKLGTVSMVKAFNDAPLPFQDWFAHHDQSKDDIKTTANDADAENKKKASRVSRS